MRNTAATGEELETTIALVIQALPCDRLRHTTLPSPYRLVRILRPIVLSQAPLVPSRQSYLRPGCTVGRQLIGHQHFRCKALFLEQLAHELHGCELAAPSLRGHSASCPM